jgi:dihydroneopterin aldolase
MADHHQIEIRRLKVSTFIGVPDEERAVPQELLVTVRITVATGFAEMADEISRTLDYAALAVELQQLAAARPRRLIETLAADVAARVLDFQEAVSVEVMVEKFILPDTECVAVHLRREKRTI